MIIRISVLNKEYEEYYENAPSFTNGLTFVQSGVGNKDVTSIVMWLRRLCKSVQSLSFYLVDSDTESRGFIRKEIKRNGKRGRPKTVIKGKKINRHIHGVIVNESEQNDIDTIKFKLTDYCRKRRKKRPNLKRQQIKNLTGMFIIKYNHRQANHTYQGGNFDFDYFKDERYFHYKNDDL